MRLKLVVGALLLGAVAGGAVFIASRDPSRAKQQEPVLDTFTHKNTGANFRYPQAFLNVQTLSAEDNDQKIIFRATEDKQQAPVLVTLRYETGLKTVANLAKVKVIDLIVDGANKSLPARFPNNYHKLDERRFKQDDREAAEILFEYEGPADQKVRQRLLLLAKDDDSAFYLSGQARASDYKEINDDYLHSLFASLRFDKTENQN